MAKKFKEEVVHFENELKKVENTIPMVLIEIIKELKDMVECDSIESFSFMQNDIYLANEKPVYIKINGAKFDDLRLGLFEELDCVIKSKKIKIDKSLEEDLYDLNSTIYFFNEHFPKKMPLVENTYYSKNAVNREKGFADHPVTFLLPTFVEEFTKKTEELLKPIEQTKPNKSKMK